LHLVGEHNNEEGLRYTSRIRGRASTRATAFAGYTRKDLALLAQQVPEAYRELIASEANRRRLDWADLIFQVTGHICGLAALVILAAVSWHAIDRGASTQGASIICTGAVSIVAVFVTGRMSKRGSSPSPPLEHDRQPEGKP
jgi:hypothetical protein